MPMPPMPAKNHDTPFASMRSDHVAVRVPDFEVGKQWFVEKLDFRIVHEWSSDGLLFAYLAPATDDEFFLELVGGGSPTPKPKYSSVKDSWRDAGYHHLCLHVDNVSETVEQLCQRGVTIVKRPFNLDLISRRLAFLADPWDNLIELSETL